MQENLIHGVYNGDEGEEKEIQYNLKLCAKPSS